MNEPFTLDLPPSFPLTDGTNLIETRSPIVIIGANGSGKTRLGSWIEFESAQSTRVHRVSAQRSLSMPISSRAWSAVQAQTELLYGYSEPGSNTFGYKRGRRWGNNPNTYLLNDYEQLMVYLFSEEAEKSINYRTEAKDQSKRGDPPVTKLDIVKELWERTLPRRELIIGSGKVDVRVRGMNSSPYNGSEMSDGERVIFYLIGQCLAAPPEGIIVIDEPEIHLHKSIQSKLWDEVEAARPDCLFVYLTHDLDFAASRIGAKKIWLKDFDGQRWDWQLLPDYAPGEGIPEEVLLSFLGSRKPVLFSEGETNSLDFFLFTHLYPTFTIIPCGNCAHVIHATRSFAALKVLHDLECCGIIDRDYRSQEQISELAAANIYALEFSEIENLLLQEDVLRIIGTALKMAESEIKTAIDKGKALVFAEMEKAKDRLISSIVASEIESSFLQFDARAQGEVALDAAVQNLLGSVNVNTLYANAMKRVNTILTDRNYSGALEIYNNKGLIFQIGPLFGMKGEDFLSYIKRLVLSDEGGAITTEMRKHIPTLSI